ncbi:DUF2752 domain-containing protein [Nocardia blacklockiae]|uniref:DUF2752 domain-containing protein n=1 Tax=Nocardia blacklockiae TaxID=480036 RepID=UPI00189363C2|nr:DUF2752 domain-containing protein [Nocardia blacklockiae]MBF6173225.1 DUF2752 domain-containing protein [Nocardia blacklockiae]
MDIARVRPSVSRGGWRGLGQPALVGGGAVAVGALLHFRDPHVPGSYSICPFYALTGWWCPGCGGLRGVHNLTEGHVVDAVHSNVLLVPLLIGFVVWLGHWSWRRWHGQGGRLLPFRIGRARLWMILAVFTLFTVFRNTPWGTWLAPV